MTEQPIGDLCVLRNEEGNSWSVALCRGQGQREHLGQFADRQQAAEFALAERDRRRQAGEAELAVHFPDDCPCYHLGREM
jgi:hypothetical protein